MAQDSGWSEKGKGSGKGKRAPKSSDEDYEVFDASDTSVPSRPSTRGDGDDTGGSGRSESSITRTPASDTGARKVARAAATAGQRDMSFMSRLGFPALIGLIFLLGIGTVFYAWTTREALAKPRQNVDHWHAVYGVYDCTVEGDDKWVPAFQSAQDQKGIHSHGDGLIHVHPFFELSSGDNALMRHFFDEMHIDVTPQKIVLDTGVELLAGTECADGSGPAEIKILHWDFDSQALAEVPPTAVYTSNLDQIKFDNDREVYTFAFAAAGTDIPLPPEERFEQLNSVTGEYEWDPNDIAPTGETDATFETEDSDS